MQGMRTYYTFQFWCARPMSFPTLFCRTEILIAKTGTEKEGPISPYSADQSEEKFCPLQESKFLGYTTPNPYWFWTLRIGEIKMVLLSRRIKWWLMHTTTLNVGVSWRMGRRCCYLFDLKEKACHHAVDTGGTVRTRNSSSSGRTSPPFIIITL